MILWRGRVLASGTGSLLFIDHVTADKSSRLNSVVYRAVLSAQIQLKASKPIRRCFRVQMDDDPKHTSKATQLFFQVKEMESSAKLC